MTDSTYYTVFDTETGYSLGTAYMPRYKDDVIPPAGLNKIAVEGNYQADKYYWDGTGPALKQTHSASALSNLEIVLGETATLDNLPIPCKVFVEGAGLVPVDDGVLTITPSSVGHYTIQVQAASIFSVNYELVVNAP